MAGVSLTREDLWDLVVGGSVLATGGNGIGPTRQSFDALVDPVFDTGTAPTLLPVDDLDPESVVYMRQSGGGGVGRADRERYLVPGIDTWWRDDIDGPQWIHDRLREMEKLYPKGPWADLPSSDWHQDLEARAVEINGAAPDAYLPFEVGPNTFRHALHLAQVGLPIVDADAAGHRAVPETSLVSFNIHGVDPTPVVFGSQWGDVIVVEKVISWQRLADMTSHLATLSGRTVRSLVAFDGETVSRYACAGSITKAIGIGRAVRAAREAGASVIDAIVTETGGRLLYRGNVLTRLNEDRDAFLWGTVHLTGTGEWQGISYKVWYKNENQMTWLDGEPHAMSPDIVTVIDPATGYGLSNFDAEAWEHGREVAVIRIPAHPWWRTERGLRIFHPARWGFACDYTPLEDIAGLGHTD